MTLADRFNSLPAPSPAASLRARPGTLADYRQLAGFHYLRHQPWSVERVLVLEDVAPGVAMRFAGACEGRGTLRDGDPRALEGAHVVGVLIESLPALSCALRDAATRRRYAGWSDRGAGARLLNREVRCISRVIVHPQWRGLGLAVRLVKWALATATTPCTEALAAMGRVHPFFELAGMRAYQRWPLAKDQRLIDALRYAGIELWELASAQRMAEHISDDGPHAGLLHRELRRWANTCDTLDEQLALARDRLLCEPVYYLKKNDQ
ncbi:MAG: hypothetical protein GC162_16770 [Planctomycetes bacterium]|nr:hypothetical protein [Planctomycetota bacterium]